MRFQNSDLAFYFRIALPLLLALAGSSSVLAQCSPQHTLTLISNTPSEHDHFGENAAISGTVAIVGARGGAGVAYLFDTTTGQQIHTLNGEGGNFGNGVAIDGPTAIVGACCLSYKPGQQGAAFLYDTSTGMLLHMLVPDLPVFENFGEQVGISGTIAIVGLDKGQDNGERSGSAFLFDTTTGEQIHKLLPNDGAPFDYFGRVGISGTIAIVGASGDDDNGENSGSAYLFDVTTGEQLFKLLPNDGAAGDRFGSRVAISGTTAIVNAPRDDDIGEDFGSAYLFDVSTGQQLFKLLPDDGVAGNDFGSRVAIDDSIALVMSFDNALLLHSAYLFDTMTGEQIGKFYPPAGGTFSAGIGTNIGISDQSVIVGDRFANGDLGAAYLFDIGCEGGAVMPEGKKLLDGVIFAGQTSDLFASDDSFLELDPSPTKNLRKQKTDLILQSTSTSALPTDFRFRLESKMLGGPSGDVVQTIRLWNFATDQFELLDTRAAAISDEIVEVVATGDLSRFVHPIVNEITASLTWTSGSFSGKPFTWSIDVDESVWIIE